MNGRMSLTRARRWAGPILLSVTVAAVGIAASATAQVSPPTADLAVISLTSRAAAARGSVVTFREVIRNNGPQTVEMDTTPQISGGVLVKEICDKGISPDTPFCEYGDVAPGQSLVTKFKIKVTASHGRLVVKGGVLSEEAVSDSNPFNQYLTRSVRITGAAPA
jgi:hypothetical protein